MGTHLMLEVVEAEDMWRYSDVLRSGNREKLRLRCLIEESLRGGKSGIFKVKWKAGKRKI